MHAVLLTLSLLVGRFAAADGVRAGPGCAVNLTTLTDVRRELSRERYKLQYGHVAVTTVEQNLAWIETKTDGHRYAYFTLDVMLRDLNKRYVDKEFATAIVHHLLSGTLAEVSRAGFKDSIRVQSDFKGLRLAVPAALAADGRVEYLMRVGLDRAFREIFDRRLIRRDDDLASLVRIETGEVADRADLRAKLARDGAVDEDAALRRAVRSQNWFATRFAGTSLAGAGHVPTRRVFALIKAFPDPRMLATVLDRRYPGAGVTPFEAVRLINYLDHVGVFTSGLHVVRRVVVSLTDAGDGGASLDFRGMNAANLAATAAALARSSTLAEALVEARAGEASVTAEFGAKIAALKLLGEFTCSGDDCVFKGRLNARQKFALLRTLNEHPLLREVRVAFIPANVAPGERHPLATHGETLEAGLRLELEMKLDAKTLDGLTFAVDARTKKLHRGELRVLIAGVVSRRQRAMISATFRRVVRARNAALGEDSGVAGAYFARP